MIFLENLKCTVSYINNISNRLPYSDESPLTKTQQKFLSFCLTGIIITGYLCWEAISRASAGRWMPKALSRMMTSSKIPWNKLIIASSLFIICQFGIVSGTLVIDDVDRERSKRTKKLFGAHKIRSKKGGFANAQSIVFIVLVTKTITLPVGFMFYRPDPEVKKWSKKDKELRKKGVPKRLRPKKPDYGKDYPPKKKIALKLLRQFKRYFGKYVNVEAITADSAYLSKETKNDCKRIFPKVPFISQLRRNLVVYVGKKNRTMSLEHYFNCLNLKEMKVTLRGSLHRTIHYTSARLFVKSLGKKVHIVAMKYENEKRLRFICCTDLSWRAEDIIQKYAFRWLVEVFFEDWKQHDGWGKSACQQNEDGARRGVILSLLLDHLLIQHPEQRVRIQSGRSLCTIGTLKRNLQFESFLQSVGIILEYPNPKEKLKQLVLMMKDLLKLRSSNKHMSGKEMHDFQGSSYLRAKYKNVA